MINNVKFFYLNLYRNHFSFLVFLLIFFGLSLNSIFNSFAVEFGKGFPYSTFLYDPNDLFADFFKVIFSFPHKGEIEIHHNRYYDLLNMYMTANPYGGIQALHSGNLNHFALPPLSALFSIICAQAMVFIDPFICFGLILLLILVAIFYTFKSLNCSRGNLLLFISAFILSYPFIFAVTRGNLYSIIAGIAVINFLILTYNYDKKRSMIMLFFLALAINIRPNLLIFVFALLVNKNKKILNRNIILDTCVFLAFAICIFIISLLFLTGLYKDYSFLNFLASVKIYHSLYVIGNSGLAYGSSLLGALKFIFNFNARYLEITSALCCLILFLFFTFLYFKQRVDKISYIFTLCGIYILGSSVLADYHLIVFFAPLALIYIDNKLNTNLSALRKIIFFTSILMLIPKNIFFIHGISLQIFLNPLILLASLFAIYFLNISKVNTKSISN